MFNNAYYAVTLIALGGIAFYVALEHAFISLRRRDLRYEAWFSLLGFCYAGLAVASYGATQATTHQLREIEIATWFQGFFHLLMLGCTAGFVQAFTGKPSPWVWRFTQAFVALGLLLHFILPHGYLVAQFGEVFSTRLPWGESVTQIELTTTHLYIPFNIFAFFLLGWASWQGVILWRSGRRKHGLLLCLGLGVAIVSAILSTLNDNGIGFGVDTIVPTLLTSLLLINFLLADELSMAPRLSRQVAESLTHNAQLSSHLDQKSHEVDTLLAVISLDLRTPLVNVLGFSDDLRENILHSEDLLATTIQDPEVRKRTADKIQATFGPSLEYVRTGARRIHHMLDAIQMISRLDRSSLQLDVCPVSRVLQQTIADHSLALQACEAQVDTGNLPACMADRALLSQVFSHLLDNSIKFRSSRRPLKINIFEKEQPMAEFARWTLIGFSDNGIGFVPSRSERLFELFHREQPNQKSEDMGIGLYLARRALWRMQGDIWAEGSEDEGATFWIALPPVRNNESAQAKASASH